MVKKFMKICHCGLRRFAIRKFFILFQLILLQVAQNKKYFYMDIPPHLLIIMTYSNNEWQELIWNILISFETSILKCNFNPHTHFLYKLIIHKAKIDFVFVFPLQNLINESLIP